MEDVLLILPSLKLMAIALCSCSFHWADLAAEATTSSNLKSSVPDMFVDKERGVTFHMWLS